MTPNWVLALVYWLHMLATVAWLGGLCATALILIPAARKTLPGDLYASLLNRIQKQLQLIGWLSLAVLTGTGMFQMSASPSYGGLLALENSWAVAIFAKHIVIVAMVAVSVYVTWGVLPALQRLALLQSAGKTIDAGQQETLRRREERLLWINLGLSVIVLLLTAVARVG